MLNLKSYLFKMATNQWMSWCRRKKLQLESETVTEEPVYEDRMFATQDSLGVLLNYLPPKERVSFVLSEVFESKNKEIAEIIGNSEGAVKAALIRAREKIKGIRVRSNIADMKTSAESIKVLELAVDAFNRRDINDFAKLFAVNAVGHAPGCFFETGVEEIKKGSLFYTINTPDGTPQAPRVCASQFTVGGESIFVLLDGDKLDDIWRFTIEDGEIVRFDCYYCCPDVLFEVAASLNLKSKSHGYWFEQDSFTGS